MTKEELEVKAKEYSVKKFDTVWNIAVKVYKAGYRACTKEVKQLGERCNQLLKDKGELIDRCRELEAQIEKMKCCGNCKNRCGQEECANCHNYSKWKFKQAEQFYEEIAE